MSVFTAGVLLLQGQIDEASGAERERRPVELFG